MSSFEHDPGFSSRDGVSPSRRPSFSQSRTSDRLRDNERRTSVTTSFKRPRRSVFREEGLEDLDHTVHPSHLAHSGAKASSSIPEEEEPEKVTSTAVTDTKDTKDLHEGEDAEEAQKSGWGFPKLRKRPRITSAASAPPATFSTIPRVALIIFLISVVIPGFHYTTGKNKVQISGVDAGVIMRAELVENGSTIEGRQTDPVNVCTRWSGQAANVNGTLYYYGGQATTKAGQTTDKWNSNFIKLDLTKSWQITSPSIAALPQPSGPPAVAEGYLWNSYDSLFLYGGEFSDAPPASPAPVSTWQYDIKAEKWTEFPNPQTSVGNFSDAGGVPVQRSAEGAGLSVPELGKSWYFGGHQDMFTTAGWSNQIKRIYLRSLLEFTHPGYANSGVASLGLTNAAPEGGVYRNITDGGVQAEAGFTERADGVLVYIPGWGDEGILLGLAGGTDSQFSEMNIIDIYDIANSTWYKQSTSGESPPIRVNPCAVVGAAPDGTSFNIYLYGGQNLIPFGSQIQYDDMYILTIPSFTWIKVDQSGQSKPPARAGHRCTMWDGQMVVLGGYVGKDIACDPGVYVFNASSLQWSNSFTALARSVDAKPGAGSDGDSASPDELPESSVIQGSVGYHVPGPVQAVIGGSAQGGATAVQPAAGSATAGPIATGKPPTFTVTQSGTTIIQTAVPTSTGGGTPSSSNTEVEKKKRNTSTIIAGVVAGVLFILAAYLAFCTWLYRRQLNLYKDHVAMAQRTGFGAGSDNGDWTEPGESGSDHVRMSQVGNNPNMLGPFGTVISGSQSGSGSAGRPSLGETSGNGLTPQVSHPQSITPGSQDPSTGHTSLSGGIVPPLPKYSPYGRFSEENEVSGFHRTHVAPSISTARSSMEDLLGGQEPSFFSVVLNPRRTLRVVNN